MARLQDVIGRGPTASRPSTPATGGIYFDTDLNAEIRWSGTAWESYERPLGTTATTAAAGNHAHTLASGDIPNNAADTTGTSGATNALKSATTTVNVSAASAPTTGQVLTATGASAATWQTLAAGFTNPMTTIDDLIVGGASGSAARLAKGADGQVLTVDPTTHHLVWATPTAGTSTLAADSDVTIASPANGQFLVYQSSSGTWVNHTLAAGDVPTLNQDTTGKSAKSDALNSATTVVNVAAATAPSTGQVLTATDSTHATWQTPASGGMADPTTTKGDLIVHGTTTTRLPVGTDAQRLVADSTQTNGVKWATEYAAIAFVIDGGGAAITTGVKGDVVVPFDCTILQATLLADQSGSIVVDVWRATYAQYDAGATHPVAADKLTASAPPTISSATKAQDATLTGWTTTLTAGDILRFNVTSATTVQRVTLALRVSKR